VRQELDALLPEDFWMPASPSSGRTIVSTLRDLIGSANCGAPQSIKACRRLNQGVAKQMIRDDNRPELMSVVRTIMKALLWAGLRDKVSVGAGITQYAYNRPNVSIGPAGCAAVAAL